MNNKEFKIGEYIVYSTNGLCRVADIKDMSFVTGEESRKYYIVEPVKGNSSTIYIPADSEKLMGKTRRAMTKDEIDSLLTNLKGEELEWEEDRKLRAEQYHEIIMGGVSDELLLMISCIYYKKYELQKINKTLSASDSKSLEVAEKLVEEEFSYVLDIKPAEVGNYIRNVLGI